MARISSQGTRMYIQDGDQPSPTTIVGISKGAPAILTFASLPPNLALGDVVIVRNSGWRSLDDKPFAVSTINPTVFKIKLYASDTQNETATLNPEAVMNEIIFKEFCMATATFSSPPGSDIDVTTMCDAAREVVAGLPALATWAATGFWDSEDPVQELLGYTYRTGNKTGFKAVFRDGTGLTYLGTTTSLEVGAGVDQAVTMNTGGSVSGGIRRIVMQPEAVIP